MEIYDTRPERRKRAARDLALALTRLDGAIGEWQATDTITIPREEWKNAISLADGLRGAASAVIAALHQREIAEHR